MTLELDQGTSRRFSPSRGCHHLREAFLFTLELVSNFQLNVKEASEDTHRARRARGRAEHGR